MYIRDRSDKYLASTSDDATIVRKTYNRVVFTPRHLLSKFQPNLTTSFLRPRVEMGMFTAFRKMEIVWNSEGVIYIDYIDKGLCLTTRDFF